MCISHLLQKKHANQTCAGLHVFYERMLRRKNLGSFIPNYCIGATLKIIALFV